MPTLLGERVAQAIRDHQVTASNRWEYRDLLAELHVWVDRFDRDFDLRLPTPVIAVRPLRYTTIASYRLGRSEIGARTTITFNEGWLWQRTFRETLATLIHELLHAWEEWHCGRETGGWYHSVPWRQKMAEVGIEADKHGRHLREGRFLSYIAERRYPVPDIRQLLPDAAPEAAAAAAPRKRRQLPKWTCGCPSGNPARAVYLHAVCQDCEAPYQRATS
jgi:hypothetical protein